MTILMEWELSMMQRKGLHHRGYRLFAGLFVLLFLAACGQNSAVAVASDKPSSPLQVSLRPLEAVAPGKIVTFEAQVSAYAPFADVLLEVDLPSPLRLVSGPQRWEGALVPGEPQGISFTVYLPTEGTHHIRATATVQGGNGALSAEAVYVVGESSGDATTGIQHAPREAHPSSDGRPVMEYEVR